ncbi:hypothetical protein Tco_0347264 [Tanacetum coccineum]
MMNEMVRNKLKVDNMQVNVQFLQQLQPEWSRFVTIVKKANNLENVSYYTLFDIPKQRQNKINEIRAERIARNANPLALVAATQNYLNDYYKAPPEPKPYKPHTPSSRQKTSTRSNATTKHKDKEIAIWESEDSSSCWEQGNYRKLGSLIQCFNCKGFRNFSKECIKSKRVKDNEYHKEKMMLSKQESKGILFSAKQNEWLQDTDEEPDEQELEAHYMCMAKI